jgi:hypothetical protein
MQLLETRTVVTESTAGMMLVLAMHRARVMPTPEYPLDRVVRLAWQQT